MKKSFLFFVSVLFSLFLPFFLFSEEVEKSVISIEQAQKVENLKDAVTGDDCILLTGNVKISVSKGKTKNIISAEKINYNRETEMLYAEGSVTLSQTDSSSGEETITASSLLFNTATLEGVFDDGRAVQTSSDAINLPSGSTLIVASDVFGRDSGGTITFKSGELTFCDDENPHWRIKASRIWLLPGGEFAFLNALLYVGHIPLFYLPAFYYPKDELVFNPTFGFRAREGYYINTTTYLYGRKPANAVSSADVDSESSDDEDEDDKVDFFSFMNTSTMKKQKREGLVLHNLDEDYTGDTSKYFKVMADYYANMGSLVGFDGVFAPGSILTGLTTNLELGFSNTVFRNNSLYLAKNSVGEIINDKSNFIGVELPFRYQANLKFVFAKPFSFTFSMPIYSDPFFDYDFNRRAETMDWIDYAMSGVNPTSSTDEVTVTETSSFTWSLSGSHSFKVPEFLNPYITNLSLSSFNSSIVYSSKAVDETKLKADSRNDSNNEWVTYTPEQKFYYPSQVVPLKASGKIAGTLIQIPEKNSSSQKTPLSLDINPPKDLFLPDEKVDNEPSNATSEDKSAEEDKDLILSESYLPLIETPSFTTTPIDGIAYSLSYSISPDFSSQLSYSSAILDTPDDFDWNEVQSTYVQFKSPSVLTSKVSYRDSFLSLTDTITFEPVYQSHPYLKITDSSSDGGYTESSAASIKKTDYSARKLDVTDENALTFKPLCYTEHFSETSLTWNTSVKLVRMNYTGADADSSDPQAEWEYLTTDLTDEDCFTVHNLNLVLAANEFNKNLYQKLSLTSTLPPQVDEYNGTLTLGFPFVTLTAKTGVKQNSSTDPTWVKEDFEQTATIKLFSEKLKFTQSYIYDMEEEESESLKFALSGFGLQAAYTASYVNGYEFITVDGVSQGWAADDEKKFQPYQFSLAYVSGAKTFKHLDDRISWSPSLSTSAVYDFLKPTDSYFKFIPGLTFKINNFLNITFSAETKNSVVYRYFCSDAEYQEKYMGMGERNILQDLIDSFRFDDVEKRKSSAFKIQSIKVEVTHDLDDWDLNCSFSIKPRLMTSSTTGYDSSYEGKSYYDFSPYFSVSVVWRPLASMKTQIVDEYGEWELNP